MRRYQLLLLLLLGATPALAEPSLRVGVVDGGAPCNFQVSGAWKGLAVDLWRAVANRERLAYELVPMATTRDQLAAVENAEVDVAIGCLSMTPTRLDRYRFSQTYQESGQAVMLQRHPLELGRSMLLSLFSPDLFALLLGFLAIFIVMALGVWQTDAWGNKNETLNNGRIRSFAKVFQILATGPGTNTIVDSVGGNSLVVLSYLLRALMASFLVSYVTVNVVRNPANRLDGNMRSLVDLQNQKVAVRVGTASQGILQEVMRTNPALSIKIVPMNRIDQATFMLESGRASAVLADEQQLLYLMKNLKEKKFHIVLNNLYPDYQGFIFAKGLEPAIAGQINRGIVEVRRSGLLQEIKNSLGMENLQ